jgi:FKBP-type peptidyl-prolyl cis-trans isomerase SlyD
VKADSVVVDANHPLAGMTLTYEVEVKSVRAATDDEIEEAAADFEAAGYCDDPTHDHSADGLVPLRSKKN